MSQINSQDAVLKTHCDRLVECHTPWVKDGDTLTSRRWWELCHLPANHSGRCQAVTSPT